MSDERPSLRHGPAKNATVRSIDEPAATVFFGKDASATVWELPDERLAVQTEDYVVDRTWPANRPSTVVPGRPMVQHPGATANRFNGSKKSRNDGVRITIEEAAVLQSLPADYPWKGSRTKQFEQCGNAVPSRLAAHVIAAAIGASADAQRLIDQEYGEVDPQGGDGQNPDGAHAGEPADVRRQRLLTGQALMGADREDPVVGRAQ